MRVHLKDYRSGRLLPVQSQIYLRGAILTHYDQGKWTNPVPRTREDQGKGLVAAGGPRPGEQWVRQEITVEPLDRDELFCIWPWSMIRGGWDSPLFYDELRGHLLRKHAPARRAVPLPVAHHGVCRRPVAVAPALRRSGVRRQRPPRGPGPVAASSPPAAPGGAGQEVGRRQRTPRRQSPRRRPPAGTAVGPCGPVSIFAGRAAPRPAHRPDRGFRGQQSPRALRILRRRAGPDAPQPGHPRPRRPGLPLRRVEQPGQVLPGPAVRRPRLGRGLPGGWRHSAGDAMGRRRRALGRRGMAPARRHAAVCRNRRPLRAGQGPAGLQLDRFPLGRLRHGNGSAAPGGGRLSPAGRHYPSDGPQSVQRGVVGPQAARTGRPLEPVALERAGRLAAARRPALAVGRGAGRLARPRPVAAGAATLAAAFRPGGRAGPLHPPPHRVLPPLRGLAGPPGVGPRRRPDAAGTGPPGGRADRHGHRPAGFWRPSRAASSRPSTASASAACP